MAQPRHKPQKVTPRPSTVVQSRTTQRATPRYWFTRKSYGYGWQPATREGWLIVGVHIVLVLTWATVIMRGHTDDPMRVAWFVGLLLVQTGLLVLISWWKGEP